MPTGNAVRDKDAFPTKQLIVLGICRFSEPIAFNSILAYSSVMVQDLGIPEKEAAFYAGLLVSAYAVAEALTALGWGAISDVYGRKPVALIGLGGVALSSLLFGLAPTYWVALLARFIGGALNGNVAVMQTMVAEMVTNPEHEPRAYATQPFVWTLGGIIGSAMGGFLAQPAKYYPNVFSQDGIFGRFPYLLPNLFAVVSIVLAIIQGIIFLEETNPNARQNAAAAATPAAADHDDDDVDERTPLNREHLRVRDSVSRHSRSSHHSFRERSGSVIEAIREIRKKPSFMEDSMPLPIDQRFDIRRTSFGTMHSVKIPHEILPDIASTPSTPSTASKKPFNFTVIMLTISLSIIAWHQMAYITNLPIYILDEPVKAGLDFTGGLGYDIHDVGTYLAVNGVIALFIQAVIFPVFVRNVGVWYSFIIPIILYPTTYILGPFISSFPEKLISPGIYLTLILQAFFGIVSFPCALILLKNATPSPLVLGRVNGLAMSACCLARTISPPLVGLIYSLGGSAAAWWSLAAAAGVGILQLIWMPREKVERVEVDNGFKAALANGDFDEAIEDGSIIDGHDGRV
ncbi:MFS general substrate transporter [Aaosphaeria arxii CBS 175.79]|uniref:MFS general substrate transporter n=1 Tax=Aaosphaeria arxii CBS 175.79 TaxID=1450172 RepID=A0A6A5Y7C1_9PLEO|nr:MFS general substrate transporter [Aaosphaeria arxii CBS 175.79]KAF2021428.1 MFS general substrate transporter [Aaosphaeria arxii CBS 175.79]